MERMIELKAVDPKPKGTQARFDVTVTFVFGSKAIKVGKRGQTKLVVDVQFDTFVEGSKIQYPPATDEEGRTAVMKGRKTLYFTDESVAKWEAFCEEMQDLAAEEQMRLDDDAE